MAEDGRDSLVRRSLIHHFEVPRLSGQIVNLSVDGADALCIQLALTIEDGLRGCRQQDVIIQSWDEAAPEPVKEAVRQTDARAPAVADDVGVVAVEVLRCIEHRIFLPLRGLLKLSLKGYFCMVVIKHYFTRFMNNM